MSVRRLSWRTIVVLVGSVGSTWLSTSAFGQGAGADEAAVTIDGEYGYGLPPDVSVHGHEIDRLINVLHLFGFITLVGWTAFMGFCLVRYRQRPGRGATYKPRIKPVHIYFVVFIAVFELILDIGFSNPVLATAKQKLPTEKDRPIHVRVMAEQFAWNFRYAGPDGRFGRVGPQHVDQVMNPFGVDPDDPNGEDDIVSGELHAAVGRPVLCQLSSKDVIHSFSIPVMRVKQDVIPGMRIPMWFEAASPGTYEIACAQLCGNNHYTMKALLVIHDSEQAYEEWLASKAASELDDEEFDEDEFED